MTPTEARAFADNLQARVDQMGERTGEGMHLGNCLSVIRGLASQIDALTAKDADPDEEVVEVAKSAKAEARQDPQRMTVGA